MALVTFAEAELILNKRPDILAHYSAHGWQVAKYNWVAIVTNWWGMTLEKDTWGGDIQRFITSLDGAAPVGAIVTREQAQFILSMRPDIVTFYAQYKKWQGASPEAIITNWWGMTTEATAYGNDIGAFIAALQGLPPPSPPPTDGNGLIPSLPPIFGFDARIVLLAGAALIVGMLFFGD